MCLPGHYIVYLGSKLNYAFQMPFIGAPRKPQHAGGVWLKATKIIQPGK